MQTGTFSKSARGFASIDKDKLRAIAAKGGKAAHEQGTAHTFSSQEAQAANQIARDRGLVHRFTPAEARLAGKKGWLARAANRSQSSNDAPSGCSAPSPAAPPEDHSARGLCPQPPSANPTIAAA